MIAVNVRGKAMSKVIYFSVDLHGHVNPSLGLINKLIESGEQVIYYSGDRFREKVESVGAEFRSYDGLVSFGTHDGRGIDTFIVFAAFIIEKSHVIVDKFLEEVKGLKPDYIIHDAFCHWGKEFAKILEVPGISVFSHFAFIDEMADMAPNFFMENILRAEDDPIYMKHKQNGGICRRLLNTLSQSIGAKYGLRNVNVINDIFCSQEKLNIIFTSDSFQIYSQAFNDSYLLTGYSIYNRKEPIDFPYEQLDGRPLVYIAFGTILNNLMSLYRNCMEAFGDIDRQVVLAVGNKVDVKELGTIPQNFIVRNYVPQLEILKRADVFITHGGANSIYEGLCFNVPLVVVPQVFDEFMGAIMVEKSGTGIYVRNREPMASELKEAAIKVWTEKSYRDNCKRVSQSFKKAGGMDKAVDEIFKFVGSCES